MLAPDRLALSHAALDATEYDSEPPPLLLTVTLCAAGPAPPIKTEKFRLEGDKEIVGSGPAVPAMMFMASDPLAAVTPIVAMPTPKAGGSCAVMVLLLHDNTRSAVTGGFATVTWHAAHWVAPNPAPLTVIVPPACTTFPVPGKSGPTE